MLELKVPVSENNAYNLILWNIDIIGDLSTRTFVAKTIMKRRGEGGVTSQFKTHDHILQACFGRPERGMPLNCHVCLYIPLSYHVYCLMANVESSGFCPASHTRV